MTDLRDNPFPVDESDNPLADVPLEEIAPSYPGGNGRSKAHAETTETFNLTDAGNARRLVAHLNGLGRYCYPFKAWYLYDGKRWPEDKRGAIFAAAKDTVKGIYAEAQSCGDDSTRKAIAAHAVRSETERALKAMIALAQSEPGIPVSPSDFDQHPDLLNCLNGTVSLRTGRIKPHDPADLLTQLIPISFDEDAPRERWEQFLKEVFKGRQELIDYLQRLIGYSITGLTTEQTFAIFHGAGANGKSTLLDVLLEVFADYMTTTPFSTFAVHRNQSIRNDLADLHNVRIVATSESSEGQRLNEELIKRATGDASIKSRFLFKEFFTYKRKFKIIMSVNHLPKIRGTDHAIWRRVRCIPFDAVFEGENCDLNLKEKLLVEAPGILAWAVFGSMLWHDMGLGCPDAVRAATDEYKAEEDTLGCFLKECCDLDPTHTQAARPLYLSYRDYCGSKTISEKAFSKNMESRGYKKATKKTGVVWSGLELLPGRNPSHGLKGEG